MYLQIRDGCSRPPRKHWPCIGLFQRCEMRKDFPPLPAWLTLTLHQFDPEVGNEKEQQQRHRQEDPKDQEPAWELPQECPQHRAHGQSHRPCRPSGLALATRAAWLSPHLFFFWESAFAQHISVELFVDFALFK